MIEEKADSKRVLKLKENSRRYSIKEGIYAASKGAFGDQFISPFAIAINSSSSMVAILSSVGGLLGPLSQTFSSRLMEKFPRKKIVLHTVFWEALMWLPFITIAALFYFNLLISMLPILLLLTFSCYIIIANIASPAWFSWVGEIIDTNHRGRWFAKRNLIVGAVSVIVALFASLLLDQFRKNKMSMEGFAILFLAAMIFRLMSWRTFKKQYAPKIKVKKKDYFSFTNFLFNSEKNNFGKFTIFRAIFSFSVAISTPLVAVYLLRTLELSYTMYMIITLSGTVFSLLLVNLWGKFADKFGNYRTMVISCVFIPIVPILWIISPNPYYLMTIPSIVGGLSWAGFNLASGNFIYDNVSPQKRGVAVSYYNLLMGIGTFLGAGVGAFLIKFLKTDFIEPILLIFLIGGVVRMIAVFFFLPQVKEVRKTKPFNGKKELKNLFLGDFQHTIQEEAHQIMGIPKYLKVR